MARRNFPPYGQPDPDIPDDCTPLQLANHESRMKEAMQHDQPPGELRELPPDLMRQLISKPFDSPAAAIFHPAPIAIADVPFMRLYQLLADSLRDRKGLKATAKGNLPRGFIREAAMLYCGPENCGGCSCIKSEDEFLPLQVVRRVAETAEMIHFEKGRWKLTENGRALMEKGSPADAYLPLFKTYTEKFAWGFNDSYPRSRRIQESFLFSLGLLAKYGGKWRRDRFYTDMFLAAYPNEEKILFESWGNRDDHMLPFRQCYSGRVLEHFAAFWGLAETEEVYRDDEMLGLGPVKVFEGRIVKRLPLLADLVTFPWLDQAADQRSPMPPRRSPPGTP